MTTRNVQIYSGKDYVNLSPVPFVGISDAFHRNEAGFLNQETTITLDGYAGATDCPRISEALEVPTVCDGDPDSASTAAGPNFAAASYIRQKFQGGSNITIKLADAKGYVFYTANQCVVDSVNIEQGDWTNYVKYQIVLKSYTGIYCDDSGDSTNGQGVNLSCGGTSFSRLTLRDSGVLTDYSESFSIEPILGEYGGSSDAFYGPQVGSLYYKGSSSVSISAKSLGNRRKFPKATGAQPKETDTGWQIARDFFEDVHGDPKSPSLRRQFLLNHGLFNYNVNLGSDYDGAGVGFDMYNLTRRESVDVHTGTFSVTDDFIIAPSGSTSLETWSTSYDSSNDSSSPTVTIQGTIKGLTQLSVGNQSRSYSDQSKHTPGPSGMIDNALGRYSSLTRNLQYGNCDLYKRASVASPLNLNSGPASISFSTNDVTGEVSYTVTYDARPYNFFTGVLTESINVEDTLPGDLYTTIPILGRPTGPILQYLYGRTEYRRTLSIDLLFDSSAVGTAVTFPTSDRSNLLASKPSIRQGFKEQLASLISAYSPAGEPGIQNWFQDPPVETWNQSECRYTCTVSWVYELNK